MRFALPLFALLLFGLAACTSDQTNAPTPVCEADLVLELTNVSPSACGIASGGFTANVMSGGAADETPEFSLNDGPFQTSPDFTNLAAGTYSVAARRGECEGSVRISISNSDGLSVEVTVENASCGDPNGSVTAVATDASGDVLYSLDGGPEQDTPAFIGLATGTYTLTATDAIGCVVEQEFNVMSTISFTSIKTIVSTNCAIPSCHGGSQSPDFREDDNIVGRAARIKARTGIQYHADQIRGKLNMNVVELQNVTKRLVARECLWFQGGVAGAMKEIKGPCLLQNHRGILRPRKKNASLVI